MKKLISLFVVLSFLFMVGAAFAESAAVAPEVQAILDRGKLRVGVKPDVPGFGYQELTGEFMGMEVDLARAMATAILGDENAVEFTAVTAKTRGPLLDTGELDMVIATYTINAERLLQYAYSKPYFVDAIGLLVKTEKGFTTLADMDGMTIGTAQAATTKDVLNAAADAGGFTLSFAEFPTYPDLKAALDSDRIACFSVDKAILMGYLDDTVTLLDDSYASQPYGVAMKLGNDGLCKVVDDTIAAMRADGSMDALVTEWNLPPIDWAEVDAYAKTLWEEAAALGG